MPPAPTTNLHNQRICSCSVSLAFASSFVPPMGPAMVARLATHMPLSWLLRENENWKRLADDYSVKQNREQLKSERAHARAICYFQTGRLPAAHGCQLAQLLWQQHAKVSVKQANVLAQCAHLPLRLGRKRANIHSGV